MLTEGRFPTSHMKRILQYHDFQALKNVPGANRPPMQSLVVVLFVVRG